MIPNMLPADELASIRAQISTLKLREAELRQGFLSGALNPVGQYAAVEVKRHRRRLLDKDRLPPAILEDDRNWRISETRAVVLRNAGVIHRDRTHQTMSVDPRQ